MKLTSSHFNAYNMQRKKEATTLPCWAPLKSMYFGFRGNTSVCCYNKVHVIGKYPEQSINEIWNSEAIGLIRDSLKQGDFSMGCEGCLELINAGNYNALPAKNFDDLPQKSASYPSKIDFELSNECNLECIMCRGEFSSSIRRNREKLPPIASVYDAEFVQQLEEFIPYIHHSHFLGGEPFMIPIYLDIWERMNELNPSIRISVQTNGTILTDRIKKILSSMKFEIAISIDSIEEENYRFIRKNGELNKVISNIHYFRDYCQEQKTNFHISYCPMIQNWKELPKVIEFANSLNCEVFFNTVSHPKSCSLMALSSSELSNVIGVLSKSELASGTLIEQKNKESYEQIIQQISAWKNAAIERESLLTITGEISDLNSYLAGLKVYLKDKTEMPFEEIERMSLDISEKLRYIISAAEEHGQADNAIKQIIGLDYQNIYRSVPTSDKEHLLYLFKSFILPLPD